MAKNISNMWVGLTGNVSGMVRPFTAAIAPVTGLVTGVKSLGGALTGAVAVATPFAAALAPVLAIGSAIATVVKGLSSLDDAAKLSDRLGISTEALSGLQHAADLAGVSSESLTGGIEKMLKTLAQAANGGKQARAALQALGLDASKVAKMEPGAAFGVIADGLQNITDPAKRAKAAMDIFGKSGQGLLPLLMSGADGIKAAQEEAERLGLTFSRVDAAKVEEANDAITRMGAVFVGLGRTIAIAIAPHVQRAADSFREFAMRIRERLAPIVPVVAATFQRVYNAVAPVVTRVVDVVSNLFRRIAPVVVGVATEVWSAVTGIFQGIYDVASPIVTSLYQAVANNWRSILAATIEFGMGVWSAVRGVFTFIGELAAAVWSGITAVWRWGTELVTGHTVSFGSAVSAIFGAVGRAATWLRETVTAALTTIGFLFENWRDVIALAVLGAEFQIVRFANQVEYVFTKVIPAVAHWFADDWQNILMDVFNWTRTVFANLASNIVNVIKNVPGLVAGTVDFSNLWTPLTEGFKRASKELVIPERQIGALESTLGASYDALNKQLGDGLASRLAGQKAAAEAAATAIGKGVADAVQSPTLPPPPPPVEPGQALKQLGLPEAVTMEVKPKFGKAIKAGSAEAVAARFGNLAARPTQGMKDAGTAVAQKQLTEAQKQTAALERIADNTEDIGGDEGEDL